MQTQEHTVLPYFVTEMKLFSDSFGVEYVPEELLHYIH